MRSKKLFAAALLLMITCLCSSAQSPQSPSSQPDTTGTPDLIVNTELLSHQWVVRDEQLDATFCSVEEGGVTPGLRRLVRFTVETPNIGDADIIVGDPNVHVANNDGLFEFATCHHHYHFRHYALYQLIDPATGFVWKAAKKGFCMLDTDPVPAANGTEPPRSSQFRSCGAIGIPGNQGISHGWADTYRFFLGGQYFILDGGDGQPVVPPGNYIIRITVNPPFTPTANEPCRFLEKIDANGQQVCHQLPESNYSNNVGEVLITIPAHPGKSGTGPAAGTAAKEDFDEHDNKIPN
ncbi:MAG TPA: lysyl oxidase family protein [Candidatus Angelobacter sp.]|nr:lysyl oxidase family protein [Candidatus Angelobacter sp.]